MEDKLQKILTEIDDLFKYEIEQKDRTIQKLRNRLDKAERENVRLISEKIE